MGDVINLQDYRKRLAGRSGPARGAKAAQTKPKPAAKPKVKPVAGKELRLDTPAEPAKAPGEDQPDS